MSRLRLEVEKLTAELLLELAPLIREHTELVGKDYDEELDRFNWGVLGAVGGLGGLLVVVARGERFVPKGYAVAVLSPDFFTCEVLCSVILLYASKGIPLLGLRLLRRVIEEARGRGVRRVLLHKTRESTFSHRIDTLAKRIGAEKYSEVYALTLGST